MYVSLRQLLQKTQTLRDYDFREFAVRGGERDRESGGFLVFSAQHGTDLEEWTKASSDTSQVNQKRRDAE